MARRLVVFGGRGDDTVTLRNEPNLSSVELATVLVTDLVGSTRMATSVGPTRADELRDEHFVVLREAIALLDGREVKNTGDGLMVAFASASAAVRTPLPSFRRASSRSDRAGSR